jgi:hypothetical protein
LDDAAARAHPLHVIRGDHPAPAATVLVLGLAAQDVRESLDPAVLMPGRPGSMSVRPVGSKVIEQRQRVVLLWRYGPDSVT